MILTVIVGVAIAAYLGVCLEFGGIPAVCGGFIISILIFSFFVFPFLTRSLDRSLAREFLAKQPLIVLKQEGKIGGSKKIGVRLRNAGKKERTFHMDPHSRMTEEGVILPTSIVLE